MSTQGSVRRNWLDAEVYTETHYFDGNPDETYRSVTVRFGSFAVEFNRWPGDGFTSRRDWSLFRGEGYLMGRTPWGNWDVHTDSDDHQFLEEHGDVPRGARPPTPEEQEAFDAETRALAACAACEHALVDHIDSGGYDPDRTLWPCRSCACADLSPHASERFEDLRRSRS